MVAPRPRLDATRRWQRLSEANIWSPHHGPSVDESDLGTGRAHVSTPTPDGARRGARSGVSRPTDRFSMVWPRLLVSSPHERELIGRGGVTWTPYSTWHLKEAGSLATACGLPSVGWRIFWNLPMESAGPDACRDCLALAHPR